MRFEFSFQKLLEVKEKEKELAQQEYGAAKNRQLELQDQLKGLEASKEKVLDIYNHVHRKTVSEILEAQQEIAHVDLQLKRVSEETNQMFQKVSEKQLILIEKTKEAKIWDQWKEKSRDHFIKQLAQKEQAMLDEVAVINYARRS